jgi:prepilin-type N-terminal cleavage/methylation domain-containing protein
MLRNRKGFTLLELIVVIVVAALLAAIAIPTFNGIRSKAEEEAGKQEASAFVKSVNGLAAFTLPKDATDWTDEALAELPDAADYDAGTAGGEFTATNGIRVQISCPTTVDYCTAGAVVTG